MSFVEQVQHVVFLPCQCASVSTHSQHGESQFVSHILLSLKSGLSRAAWVPVSSSWWLRGQTCKITHWCRQIKFCLGHLQGPTNLLLTNLPQFQLHWKIQWNQALIRGMTHYGTYFWVWNENLFFKEEISIFLCWPFGTVLSSCHLPACSPGSLYKYYYYLNRVWIITLCFHFVVKWFKYSFLMLGSFDKCINS